MTALALQFITLHYGLPAWTHATGERRYALLLLLGRTQPRSHAPRLAVCASSNIRTTDAGAASTALILVAFVIHAP